jgi:hypothetical protein
MDLEADRRSDAMIAFFGRFNPDGGMIAGNEYRDTILSRLDKIDRNKKTVNIKMGTILSCAQREDAIERDNRWIHCKSKRKVESKQYELRLGACKSRKRVVWGLGGRFISRHERDASRSYEPINIR